MVLFSDDNKTYALQEIESSGAEVLGKCEMSINKDKAKFLATNCKGHKDHTGEDREKYIEALTSCEHICQSYNLLHSYLSLQERQTKSQSAQNFTFYGFVVVRK